MRTRRARITTPSRSPKATRGPVWSCVSVSREREAVRPLRVYLLILVLGALLPGMLLTGVLVWRAFENNHAASERRLLDSARVDAAALDREFAGTISTLQALA